MPNRMDERLEFALRQLEIARGQPGLIQQYQHTNLSNEKEVKDLQRSILKVVNEKSNNLDGMEFTREEIINRARITQYAERALRATGLSQDKARETVQEAANERRGSDKYISPEEKAANGLDEDRRREAEERTRQTKKEKAEASDAARKELEEKYGIMHPEDAGLEIGRRLQHGSTPAGEDIRRIASLADQATGGKSGIDLKNPEALREQYKSAAATARKELGFRGDALPTETEVTEAGVRVAKKIRVRSDQRVPTDLYGGIQRNVWLLGGNPSEITPLRMLERERASQHVEGHNAKLRGIRVGTRIELGNGAGSVTVKEMAGNKLTLEYENTAGGKTTISGDVSRGLEFGRANDGMRGVAQGSLSRKAGLFHLEPDGSLTYQDTSTGNLNKPVSIEQPKEALASTSKRAVPPPLPPGFRGPEGGPTPGEQAQGNVLESVRRAFVFKPNGNDGGWAVRIAPSQASPAAALAEMTALQKTLGVMNIKSDIVKVGTPDKPQAYVLQVAPESVPKYARLLPQTIDPRTPNGLIPAELPTSRDPIGGDVLNHKHGGRPSADRGGSGRPGEFHGHSRHGGAVGKDGEPVTEMRNAHGRDANRPMTSDDLEGRIRRSKYQRNRLPDQAPRTGLPEPVPPTERPPTPPAEHGTNHGPSAGKALFLGLNAQAAVHGTKAAYDILQDKTLSPVERYTRATLAGAQGAIGATGTITDVRALLRPGSTGGLWFAGSAAGVGVASDSVALYDAIRSDAPDAKWRVVGAAGGVAYNGLVAYGTFAGNKAVMAAAGPGGWVILAGQGAAWGLEKWAESIDEKWQGDNSEYRKMTRSVGDASIATRRYMDIPGMRPQALEYGTLPEFLTTMDHLIEHFLEPS